MSWGPEWGRRGGQAGGGFQTPALALSASAVLGEVMAGGSLWAVWTFSAWPHHALGSHLPSVSHISVQRDIHTLPAKPGQRVFEGITFATNFIYDHG